MYGFHYKVISCPMGAGFVPIYVCIPGSIKEHSIFERKSLGYSYVIQLTTSLLLELFDP